MGTTTSRRVTVLGDGGWGTCLAILLAGQGNRVTLWGAFADYVAQVRRSRENLKFLPGVAIPDGVALTSELAEALAGPEAVVVAVPSQYLRQVLQRAAADSWGRAQVISVVKGIEPDTLLRMSQLIRALVPAKRLAVLSGPSISYEVARGIPTTVVAASEDPALAREVQALFSTERFRVYTSTDVVGVELGGALKNVIAIACGAADGLGFGTNTKAALMTRGLVEMARLGAAMGAKGETFSGLSGLGDLITTCFSPHSRNRRVGEEVGKGRPMAEVTQGMAQVAEGVTTARSAQALARKHRVDMPIAAAVVQVLYEGKSPKEAVRELMLRDPKPE
ncbi:MAG: NAD(P)-dependent glycerol-3-phosphate dehydrogenase [Candidatus Omnitrophica bacterium]|nr:NAD(P)-dependent glycerol-3-phosphate dehydrogenase [Candidatus Omnitrophota bacterium]